MEKNPGKILQMSGIEVSPNDTRPTKKILADVIANSIEIVHPDENREVLSDSVIQVMESGCARRQMKSGFEAYIGCALCVNLHDKICDTISSVEATGL